MEPTNGIPQRLLIVDIDGLRQDVFHQALAQNQIPNIARLLQVEQGGAVHLDPVSTAPSITFCAQSTIFTGAHPQAHGVLGNQFFDRFGRTGRGPRFFAFDVGDVLAYDDAVETFTGEIGLVGKVLDPRVPTLYERAARNQWTSTVIYHMVSRGATRWIRPSLVDIARFTKGGGLLGMSAEQYDGEMLQKTLDHLRSGARPDVLTVYFMGLDHVSHSDGPGAQPDYLARVIDPLVGRLIAALEAASMLQDTLVTVVSDHGHIQVVPDDRHSLRLSFPFDREMGYLFDALGLDVHDKPGEAPACDAVVASNGGMAFVYLRKRIGEWSDLPYFSREVLPVARAFWEANATGKYSGDLQGSLHAVLVRNVEQQGWDCPYQALSPEGQLLPLEDFFAGHPTLDAVEAAARLSHLTCPNAGDLLLVSNYKDGFYFGDVTLGVHGGLHPEDSLAVASLSRYGAAPGQQSAMTAATEKMAAEQRAAEGRNRNGLVDVVPIITQLLGWQA